MTIDQSLLNQRVKSENSEKETIKEWPSGPTHNAQRSFPVYGLKQNDYVLTVVK